MKIEYLIKFNLFVLLSISIGCQCKQVYVEPVPMIELITPYFEDSSNGRTLNIEKFNVENKKWGKIIPIINESNNLEFFVIFKNSPKVLYYKNGIEHFYVEDENAFY